RARPDKQADLNALALADAGHLLDVSLAEQQHAAALAHAVDGHLVLFRGLDHTAKHPRPFDARDLEPVLSAIGKALLGGFERVVVLRGKFELGEKLLGLFHTLLLEAGSAATRDFLLLEVCGFSTGRTADLPKNSRSALPTPAGRQRAR